MNSSERHSDAGQDVVEYVLVLPLLLLLLFGIVDFGMVFMRYTIVANAAREGARAGMLPISSICDAGCRDANAVAAAQELTAGLDPAELTIDVDRPTVGSIQVSVTYEAGLMTGIIIDALGGQDTITLHSTATMQSE